MWLTAGPGLFTSVYLLRELGSARAFKAYVKGSLLEPSADLFCDVARRHPSAASLLDDIDIRPRSTLASWVEELDIPFPPGTHWTMMESGIFKP